MLSYIVKRLVHQERSNAVCWAVGENQSINFLTNIDCISSSQDSQRIVTVSWNEAPPNRMETDMCFTFFLISFTLSHLPRYRTLCPVKWPHTRIKYWWSLNIWLRKKVLCNVSLKCTLKAECWHSHGCTAIMFFLTYHCSPRWQKDTTAWGSETSLVSTITCTCFSVHGPKNSIMSP